MSVAGIRKIVVLQLILLFCMNCDQKHSIIEGKSMEIRNDLKILATKRIFFGHQSVGQNIVEALKDIAQQNSEADFHIVTPMDDEKLPAHFFAEGKIGRNQQPELKCKDFQEQLQNSLGSQLDFALMKFCYIDFDVKTDVEKLFSTYKNTIDTLKRQFPSITFIHVTAPLEAKTPAWKFVLKKILLRNDDADKKNIKRCEYNQLLRESFKTEPIFDLAAVESTFPDGRRQIHDANGKKYFSLIWDYSDDGGHLNSLGAERAAVSLIKTLSNVCKTNGVKND